LKKHEIKLSCVKTKVYLYYLFCAGNLSNWSIYIKHLIITLLFQMFKSRRGAVDQGSHYEYLNIANVALNLLFDEEVINFKISYNIDGLVAEYDIVLEIECKNGEEKIYLIQLKHTQGNKQLLNPNMLTSKQGQFSISKYFKSYKEIPESYKKKSCQ